MSSWKWRWDPPGNQDTVVGRSGDLTLGRPLADVYHNAQKVCISIFFESCNCFSGCPTLQQSLHGLWPENFSIFKWHTIMPHHIVSVIDFKGSWLTSSWNNKAVTGVLWATPKTTPEWFATHNRGCTWKAASNDQFWLKTFVFSKVQ